MGRSLLDCKGLGRWGCLKTENCRSMKVLSHRKGGPGPAHVQGGADWGVRSGSEQFVRGTEQPVEEVAAACGEPQVARVILHRRTVIQDLNLST